MKRILVLHGPNLNLLGEREPAIYGTTTLDALNLLLTEDAARLGLTLEIFQSNHEGMLVDRLQAERRSVSGVLLNPGGLTHSSVSLRDAVAALPVPVIVIHLSNLHAREGFRRRDLIAPVCRGVIQGLGPVGYRTGLVALAALLDAETPQP